MLQIAVSEQTMMFPLLLCFAAVLQSQASNLYPYLDSGTVHTSGIDGTTTVPCPMGISFPFYGSLYDTVYTSRNAWVAMTDPNCACWTGIHTPGGLGSGIAYLSDFWCDHNLGSGGTLYIKKVEGATNPVERDLVTAHAALIGVSLVPTVIFIATWDEVGGFGKAIGLVNTHQIVIASDGFTTVSIFNFDRIDWFQSSNGAAIQFGKGDGFTWAPLSISGNSESKNAPCYSNVGIPGRIVTRVDGSIITAPTITCLQVRKCTIDLSNGGIKTFDGDTSLSADEDDRKYLISKPSQTAYNSSNQCKFMLRMATDDNGVISLFRFSIGVGNNNNYAQQLNFNVAKYQWKTGGNKFVPPYTNTITDGGQDLEIHVDPEGDHYVIWSPDCDYRVHVDSDGKVELILQSTEYDGTLIGMCQDGDGDDSNDNVDCDVCDTCGSPSGVHDTCSCSPDVGGSDCNDHLKEL